MREKNGREKVCLFLPDMQSVAGELTITGTGRLSLDGRLRPKSRWSLIRRKNRQFRGERLVIMMMS